MKFSPDATNASSSLNEVGSSAVHPNMLPPNVMGPISRLEFPSLRLITLTLLFRCRPDASERLRRKDVSREAGLAATVSHAGASRGEMAGQIRRHVCYDYLRAMKSAS